MVEIQLQSNLKKIAAYIARMNQLPEHHNGYCGTNQEETLHTMEEDFTDVAAKDAFVVAIENDEIVSSDNEKAIHLYKKIGFEVEHELILFEEDI